MIISRDLVKLIGHIGHPTHVMSNALGHNFIKSYLAMISFGDVCKPNLIQSLGHVKT